ncbi:MAG: MutS-related protein, partial [Chitinivibrionales bacterium]
QIRRYAPESPIITGSNMSGKSTFLRTVGINLVLGYAGAPVCASRMGCSPIHVYTSMRIGDNLRNNVSTFYAELLRIKKIVDAVKRKENILFLLDELFRGTNSQDRHDGAVAVVKALKTDHTLGIISTHDLQLSELGQKDTSIYACHFKEYYVDQEIHFDYKLYPGPSTTRNAMFLIRTMGIPV